MTEVRLKEINVTFSRPFQLATKIKIISSSFMGI
jgi:hypothetical protein